MLIQSFLTYFIIWGLRD